MRPERISGVMRLARLGRRRPLEGPELAGLEAELLRAGARARMAAGDAGADLPAPAFSAALRRRLVAELPEGGGMRVLPRIGWRQALPASGRFGLAAAAALIVVAALGPRILRPAEAPPRLTAADGAVLVRDGLAAPVEAGTVLRAGDAVRTAAGGRATLEFGSALARLDGASQLRVLAAAGGRVSVAQDAGRAWHRVAPGSGGRYSVETGEFTWTTLGTAFDLRRAADGETVRLLALEHDVALAGGGTHLTVPEGRAAVVRLGSGEVSLRAIEPRELADAWLTENAALDDALGWELAIAPQPPATESPSESPSADPSGAPTSDPSAAPSAPPSPTAEPTPVPMPKPTPVPTPRPTPVPTPRPTPVPIADMSLGLTACPGGVVLEWSKVTLDGFGRYVTLRNTEPTAPRAYPPQNGAKELDATSSADRYKTSALDTGASAGVRHYYRTLALDAADRVIAASSLVSVVPAGPDPAGLGSLAMSGTSGALSASWSPFEGSGACFSAYKLVYSADDPTPSYFSGAPAIWAGADKAAAGAGGLTIEPGSYWFRLQVIRQTALGKILVAQSEVTQFTVVP